MHALARAQIGGTRELERRLAPAHVELVHRHEILRREAAWVFPGLRDRREDGGRQIARRVVPREVLVWRTR